MSDGTVVAILLNKGPQAANATVPLSLFGSSWGQRAGAVRMKDLWAHADLPPLTHGQATYTVTVRSHAAVAYRLTLDLSTQGDKNAAPLKPVPVAVSVDTTKIAGAKVNPLWLGCHMDLGFAHPARGIYAQLLYGESFEFGHNSTWSYQPEHGGRTDIEPAALSGIIWNLNGSASFDKQFAHHGYVSLHAKADGDGASNRGMGNEGLSLEGGKPYEGRFYARADDSTGATVVLSLRNYATGSVLASTTVEVPPHQFGAANFSRFNFSLTPVASTDCHGIPPGSDPEVLCGQQCGKPTPVNCTVVPQPCPTTKGHTYCISDPRPNQCQRPPVASCPPCPKPSHAHTFTNPANPHCMAGPPPGTTMGHDGHICIKCAGELYIGSTRGSVHIDYVYLQPGQWGRFGEGCVLVYPCAGKSNRTE